MEDLLDAHCARYLPLSQVSDETEQAIRRALLPPGHPDTITPCGDLMQVLSYTISPAAVQPCNIESDRQIPANLSLGAYFHQVATSLDQQCNACDDEMHKHTRQMCHNDAQISVTAAKSSSKRLSVDNKVVKCWVLCTECHTQTPVKVMSHRALQAKLSDYLHLLIDDPLFTVHGVPLCKAPVQRLSRDPLPVNRLMRAYNKSKSHEVREHIMQLGGTGASHSHRQHLVRCYQLATGVVVSVSYTQIGLYGVQFPTAQVDTTDVVNSYKSLPTSLDELKPVVDRAWSEVTQYLQTLLKASRAGDNRMLPKYTQLVIDMVRLEESNVKAFIEATELERKSQRMRYVDLKQLKSGSQATIQEIPNSSSRDLRQSIFDKVVSVHREVSDFVATACKDHPQQFVPQPQYQQWIRTTFPILSQLPNNYQPATLAALAMQSQEVRDLLDVLEKVDEIASSLVNPKESFDKYKDGESLELHLNLMQQVLVNGGFKQQMCGSSHDGLMEVTAAIVDARDITVDVKLFGRGERKTTDSGTKLAVDFQTLIATFTVTIHYALFHQYLRTHAKIMDGSFASSLQLTKDWQPRGGKSASDFQKTADGKFVLKSLGMRKAWSVMNGSGTGGSQSSLSRPTVDRKKSSLQRNLKQLDPESRMMLQFTPKYISYIMRQVYTYPAGETLLTKLYGSFRVQFESHVDSSESYDRTFVVMEQLFSGINVRQKFDLKGVKSRQVASPVTPVAPSLPPSVPPKSTVHMNGEPRSVAAMRRAAAVSPTQASKYGTLWDGNWVSAVNKRAATPTSAHPVAGRRSSRKQQAPKQQLLYFPPQDKRRLIDTLQRDTDFLQGCGIVDYSLLAAIGSDQKCVMVGVVDYFTEYGVWRWLESGGKTALKVVEQALQLAPISSTAAKRQPSTNIQTKVYNLLSGSVESLARIGTTTENAESAKPNAGVLQNAMDSVTIQSPERYAQRFMAAMHSYFMSVPSASKTS